MGFSDKSDLRFYKNVVVNDYTAFFMTADGEIRHINRSTYNKIVGTDLNKETEIPKEEVQKELSNLMEKGYGAGSSSFVNDYLAQNSEWFAMNYAKYLCLLTNTESEILCFDHSKYTEIESIDPEVKEKLLAAINRSKERADKCLKDIAQISTAKNA